MQIRTLLVLLFPTLLLFAACRHTPGHIAEPQEICGCMDINALNNNPEATKCDPTQCRYAIDSVTGVYDVIDTYAFFTSMGPDTIISNMAITVTKESASTLLFDTLLICTKCANGGIPYTPASHSFYYSNYIDPYTMSGGSGNFVGNTLHYRQSVSSSFSGYTPSHRGAGSKRG